MRCELRVASDGFETVSSSDRQGTGLHRHRPHHKPISESKCSQKQTSDDATFSLAKKTLVFLFLARSTTHHAVPAGLDMPVQMLRDGGGRRLKGRALCFTHSPSNMKRAGEPGRCKIPASPIFPPSTARQRPIVPPEARCDVVQTLLSSVPSKSWSKNVRRPPQCRTTTTADGISGPARKEGKRFGRRTCRGTQGER